MAGHRAKNKMLMDDFADFGGFEAFSDLAQRRWLSATVNAIAKIKRACEGESITGTFISDQITFLLRFMPLSLPKRSIAIYLLNQLLNDIDVFWELGADLPYKMTPGVKSIIFKYIDKLDDINTVVVSRL